MMRIEKSISVIEEIFEQWEELLGADYWGYKNHVYRLVHFCSALCATDVKVRQKFEVAACFHDVGIWANNTFDYLDVSAKLAKNHLIDIGKPEWVTEIALMIQLHHKIISYKNAAFPMVEVFRKADWVDVTKGKRGFGLLKSDVEAVMDAFPNHGFHKKLAELTKKEFRKNPFNPLPMLRW